MPKILQYIDSKVIDIRQYINEDEIPTCPICGLLITQFPMIGMYDKVYCLIHEKCIDIHD